MARSGNLAEWERRLAEQRREDERLARERRQAERERERARPQEREEPAQQDAQEQTAALDEQVKGLDGVLTSVLDLPPVTFDRLLVTAELP
jgi:chromosome segregation ATPase